jgi:hypothetical protein
MSEMEPEERLESVASGVEPIELDAAASLADAERRAQAEAAKAEPVPEHFSERLQRQVRKILGR